MNTKGFELSTNMLVVIILSLVLFGVGLFMFNNMITQGFDFELKVSQQIQDQLNAVLDDGSLIVVPVQTINSERGKIARFSFGFRNEFEKTDFRVTVTPNQPQYFDSVNDLAYIVDYPNIETNEKVYALLAIFVPKETPKGQYSFDIKIEFENPGNSNWEQYDKINRIYVIVP